MPGFTLDEFFALADDAPVPSRNGYSVPEGTTGGKWSLLYQDHPEGGGPFGGRDNALTVLCGFLRAKRIPFDAAQPMAFWWNEKYCKPPLPESEVWEKLGRKWREWEVGNLSDLTPEEARGEKTREVLSIGELFARADEFGQVEYLIQNGFALKRLHVISAPPGGAKSWVAMSLAQSLVTGHPWLERFPVPQGSCLWIDQEMGHQLMIQRLTKLGFDKGAPFFYMGYQGLRLDDPADVVWLARYVADNEIKMVVLDSLRRMHRLDENSNSEMGRLLGPMQAIGEAGAAVVLIHHDRKKGADSDVAHESAAGAGDLIAQMDMAFGVSRLGGNAYRLTCRKPRLCAEDVALTVDFTIEDNADESETYIREMDPSEKIAKQDSEAERRVLDMLQGGTKKVRDMEAKGGTRKGTIGPAAKRLAERGLVVCTSGPHGALFYSLPGDEPE